MSHVLRVLGFCCLLAPICTVQAQTQSKSSLIAVQVERKAAENPANDTDTSREAPVTTSPAAAPAVVLPTAAPVELVTIKGQVLDEAEKPLAGVVVFAKDVAAIASTDAKGEYSLQVPAGVNTLTFSYAGYDEQQLKASNFLPTKVQLLPASNRKKLAKNSRR